MNAWGTEAFGGLCAEKTAGNHAPGDEQTGAWHKPSRTLSRQPTRHSGDSADCNPEFAGLTDEVS